MPTNKVFYSLLILFLSLLNANLASGQILHIDRQEEHNDSSRHWAGKFGLSFELNNQDADAESNFNYLGLTTNFSQGYFTARHAYLWLNYFNYMTTPEEAFLSTGYTHLRANFFRKKKLSYEIFTQLQYDASRGLNRRTLGGAGIRYRLHEKGSSSVYVGTGLMQEDEHWKSPQTTEELPVTRVQMLKSTNYLTANLKFSEKVNLSSTAYFQTGYHQAAELWRHRFSLDASLNLKITNKIAFTTALTSTFENRPVVPIKRFIYTLTHGISVEI